MYITTTELWILFLCCIIVIALIVVVVYEYEKLSRKYEMAIQSRNKIMQEKYLLQLRISDVYKAIHGEVND